MKWKNKFVKALSQIFSRPAKHRNQSMVFLFEKDGHKYYKFPKNTNLPLDRFSEMMALQELLSSGLSGSEVEKILEVMEKAIHSGLANPQNSAVISTCVHLIRQRKSNIVHRDLLLNIAAIWIVRDDEPIESITLDIHKSKLEVFERMTKEDSHGFFTSLELPLLVPLVSMSPTDFKELWENNANQMRTLTQQLTLLDSNLVTSSPKLKQRSMSN